jgi:hypothetical protein
MTNPDTLAMYAELYRDFPELVPEGVVVCGDDYEAILYGARINGDTDKHFNFEGDNAPPWFLTLALGALVAWLEGRGYQIIKQWCGRWCIFRMDFHGLEPHGEPQWDDAHEAAIAAVRMVKEQA